MKAERPPEPIPSASVILARDGSDGLEVLMVRRHRDTAFGSADAFPGGKLCADDVAAEPLCAGIGAAEANRRLAVESGALGFYSAAVRELFEETGVLLARGEPGPAALSGAGLEVERAALVAGQLRWPSFLAERRIRIAAHELHYAFHWEAPERVRPRFATRFFVAIAPAGQPVRYDGREIIAARWLSPERALSMERTADINLPFPTRKNLQWLSGFRRSADLLAWAADCWRGGIRKMTGVVIEEGGRKRIVLPGEPGYPGERR